MALGKKDIRSSLLLGCAGLALNLVAAPAFAQDGPVIEAPEDEAATAEAAQPTAESEGGEVIIVTTERREQNLQDVAGTVAAFSGEDLQLLGVNDDFTNLQYVVPGLQITNNEGRVEVFLRGIGSFDAEFSSDPSVATYFNGIYIGRPRGIGLLFFDSERTEVAKGPQGTLRGRNSAGGSINIISTRPEFDEFYGYAQGEFGNFSTRGFEAAVNIPITEDLAVRGSLFYKENNSLYTNAFFDAGAEGEDFNDGPGSRDDITGRLSVLWEPTDKFSWYFLWQRSDVNAGGEPGVFHGRSLAAGFDIEDLDDPYNQFFRSEGDFDQQVSYYLTQLNYETKYFNIEYNGSFSDTLAINQNSSRVQGVGSVFPGVEDDRAIILTDDPVINPFFNINNTDTFHQGEQSQAIIQELRLYGDAFQDRLFWTAGVFYYRENFDGFSFDVGNGFCSQFIGPQPDKPFLGDNPFSCFQNGLGGEFRNDDSIVESIAGYGDFTFSVTDSFRIKGGVRYTSDKKTQTNFNAAYQFNINDEFFLDATAFGIPSIGIDSFDDTSAVGPGFTVTPPGERTITEVVPGQEIAFFLDGIAAFGIGDNFDDLLINCDALGLCEGIITSTLDNPFTPGVEVNSVTSNDTPFVDFRAGVEYDVTEDNLVYATVSTGTRSGGLNLPIFLSVGDPDVVGPGGGDAVLAPDTFDEETLTLIELGTKNEFEFAGIYGRINLAGFYYSFEDLIVQVLADVPFPLPGNPGATTQRVINENVGDARAFGIEFESSFALPYGLNVAANYLYLDAQYEEAIISDTRTGDFVIPGDPTSGVSIEGNELMNTSRHNVNIRVQQTIPIGRGLLNSFDWNVNINYRSSFFLSPLNNQDLAFLGGTIEGPGVNSFISFTNQGIDQGGVAGSQFFRSDVPGFVTLNAVVGINFGEDDRFRLDGFVENATNTAFSGRGFINSAVNIRFLNPPRQFGGRLRVRF